MIPALTWAIVGVSSLLMVVAGFYAWKDRLIDDRILLLAAVIEVALLVCLFSGMAGIDRISDSSERATFVAYLVSLPFVPVGTAFLAIKEKTRWSMGTIAVGAFAVAVMMLRCQQIWNLYV